MPATVGYMLYVHYFTESLLNERYWSEAEPIALKERKVLEWINQWIQEIMHKPLRRRDNKKGCCGENWRMSTFGGLQRETDRVGIGPSGVPLSIKPHVTLNHPILNELCIIWNNSNNKTTQLTYTLSAWTLLGSVPWTLGSRFTLSSQQLTEVGLYEFVHLKYNETEVQLVIWSL